MPQRHNCKDGEDADGDEDALHDPRGDGADGHDLVLPLDDRENHNRGADVRDDEDQFQEHPEVDAVVRTGSGDVARRIVENRLKQKKRCDQGREGDQVQHPKPQRNRSLWAHVDSHRRVTAAPILEARGTLACSAPARNEAPLRLNVADDSRLSESRRRTRRAARSTRAGG
jgi:hypothetical protein